MKKIGAKRLKKLAEHLYSGTLIHKKFDFGYFNKGAFDENGCGTMGCAIGECPAIFKEWEFRGREPILKKAEDCPFPLKSVSVFFHITSNEAQALFVAEHQDLVSNLQRLYEDATKEEVANNIKRFIIYKGFEYDAL